MRKKSKWRFLWMILTGVGIYWFLHIVVSQNPHLSSELNNLLTCIIITMLVWEGNILLDSLLNKKLPWEQKMASRVVAQLFASTVYTVTIIYISLFIFNTYVCKFPPEKQANFILPSILIGVFTSFIILSIYISSDFYSNWKKSLVEIEQHKTYVAQSALNNLKNQINPHFLFNNLSVLTSLIQISPDKATQFVGQLSKVYRYLIENKDNELTTLQDEMRFLDPYIFLLQIRYEDAFEIQKTIPNELLNKQLPPMALQLLFENAIKHNEVSKEHPLLVTISTENEAYIVVSNNFQPRRNPEKSSKTGLENLRKQYEFFTEKRVVIEETKTHFIVKLPLIHLR